MKLKVFFFPVTLVLSIVILIWFTKPGWEEYKVKKSELSKLVQEKRKVDEGFSMINIALDDYELMEDSSKKLITNAIPMDKNNDDFIAEIHKNVIGSGVFLAGTKLKENKITSSASRIKKIEAESSYVAPETLETSVEVEVVGNYLNVKSFIEKVDTENRFSIPKEISITKLKERVVEEAEAEEGAVSVDDNLVRARIIFLIYDKQKDEGVQLSNLSGVNDDVMRSLLSSGLKKQIIDNYKSLVTSALFKPVTSQNAGKQDLFAK